MKRTNRGMKLALLVLITAIAVLSGGTAKAEKVVLETPKIEVQETAVWCWAASMQNLLASHDVKVKMDAIVEAAYGRVVNLPLYDPGTAVAGFVRQNQRVAGKGKVIHPFFSRGFSHAAIVRELEEEKAPFMVMYRNSPIGGHVVVCYGVEYDGKPQRPDVTKYYIKDPIDGKEKTVSPREMDRAVVGVIQLRICPKPPDKFKYDGYPYSVQSDFSVYGTAERRTMGRIFYSNKEEKWMIIRADDVNLGPIPD